MDRQRYPFKRRKNHRQHHGASLLKGVLLQHLAVQQDHPQHQVEQPRERGHHLHQVELRKGDRPLHHQEPRMDRQRYPFKRRKNHRQHHVEQQNHHVHRSQQQNHHVHLSLR